MNFKQLTSSYIKIGKSDGHTLIIMPFYNEYLILKQHLKLLSLQTCKKFDLIIVMDMTADQKHVLQIINEAHDSLGFCIIVAQSKNDVGAAGAIFTGEKYALENNYDQMIHADVDSFPISKNLIETLLEERAKGSLFICPKTSFLISEKEGCVLHPASMSYYSLVDCSITRKVGLHFLPCYIGAYDSDLNNRISSVHKPKLINSLVTHPIYTLIFCSFEKNISYRINDMLILPNIRLYLYNACLVVPIYLFFGISRIKKGAIHILKSILFHLYGKKAIVQSSIPKEQSQPPVYDLILSPIDLGVDNVFRCNYDNWSSNIPSFCRKIIGKKILLYPIGPASSYVNISMILAKETWVHTKNNDYLVAKNDQLIIYFIKITLFILTFPLFFLFGISTFLLNYIRKPKTFGYGLATN